MDFLYDQMFAHRGLFNEENPENSLGAFSSSIQNGFGIELDVHLLADGEVVVFHDFNLERMTGFIGELAQYNYSDISKLRLKNTQYYIPTLKEVLQLVDGKVPVIVELKTEHLGRNVGDLEKRVVELLANYRGQYSIQSFNPFTVWWFKIHSPDVIRGLLSWEYKPSEFCFIDNFILSNLLYVPFIKPNYICYHWKTISKLSVKFFHDIIKIPLLVYTIKSEEERSIVENNCDNIIFEGFIP